MVTDVCQHCGESVDEEGGEDTCEDGDKGCGEDVEDGYEGGFLPDTPMDKQTMVIVVLNPGNIKGVSQKNWSIILHTGV